MTDRIRRLIGRILCDLGLHDYRLTEKTSVGSPQALVSPDRSASAAVIQRPGESDLRSSTSRYAANATDMPRRSCLLLGTVGDRPGPEEDFMIDVFVSSLDGEHEGTKRQHPGFDPTAPGRPEWRPHHPP